MVYPDACGLFCGLQDSRALSSHTMLGEMNGQPGDHCFLVTQLRNCSDVTCTWSIAANKQQFSRTPWCLPPSSTALPSQAICYPSRQCSLLLPSNKETDVVKLAFFVQFLLFLRQCLTMQPLLAWNSLHRSGWSQIQRSVCLCFFGAAIKECCTTPGLNCELFLHSLCLIDNTNLHSEERVRFT